MTTRDAGVEEQFVEFVAHRQHALLRTAYLLTGERHAAEDLLQTALTKTYLAWSRVDPSTAEAYVKTVLTRTYISWWRRTWRGERSTEDMVAAEAFARPELRGAGGSATTGDSRDLATSVTDRSFLLELVRTLPPRQRAAVVLRFYEDMSEAQAAQVLGCSVGTVKSQTSRALATLRTRVHTDDAADAASRGELA